jgi:hypothetical protein
MGCVSAAAPRAPRHLVGGFNEIPTATKAVCFDHFSRAICGDKGTNGPISNAYRPRLRPMISFWISVVPP